MKKTVCLLVALALIPACRHEVVMAPIEAPIAATPTVAIDSPPPDPPRPNLFPAGPGVTHTFEQLNAIIRDRRVTDKNVPWNERVALVEAAFGPGEPFFDMQFEGMVWRGVSGRGSNAPFGCSELIISHKDNGATWIQRSADHRLCGLPYATDETKPYVGHAPRQTVSRLEEVLGEAGALAPERAAAHARARLGPPELTSGGEEVWYGIGPRDKSAPITCNALHLGSRPRVDQATLTDCSLAWPMPGMSFEPGPTDPPLSKEATLASCNCSSSQVCMLDQRVPYMALMRTEADGLRARYPDGRSAKAELVASCVAIPPTCTTLSASCFFPSTFTPAPANGNPLAAMAGPCPSRTYTGRAFQTVPTNHILCFSRIGGPSVLAPPPPPPPPQKPGTAPTPATRASSTPVIF
jgi:hypothetical protein